MCDDMELEVSRAICARVFSYKALALALIWAWALGGAESARASFASVVGVDAAYCVASSQWALDPEPCVVEDLDLSTGDCWAATFPTCDLEDATVEGSSAGSVYGETYYLFEGDIGLYALLNASSFRIDPLTVQISGQYVFWMNYFWGCPGTDLCGSAEIALFRYAGDPAAFSGLVPITVSDFVAAGLIENSDILFVHTDFPEPPGQANPLSFEVHVGEIPDSQLYFFSTFQTPLPEPSGPATLFAGTLGLYGLARIRTFRASSRVGRRNRRYRES